MSRYNKLIEKIFELIYTKDTRELVFQRSLFEQVAKDLDIDIPKNIGDVIYSYRYRKALPDSIRNKAPEGLTWIIRPAGDGIYKFVAVKVGNIAPSSNRLKIKIPNATPSIVAANALGDEQALLAVLRYNRLIDLFLKATCYSMQNHLRTKVPGIGQIEVDELYLGIDRTGTQFVIPIQAKGGRDQMSVVQIEQDIAFSRYKFPHLMCRAIGAQFMGANTLALLEFAEQDEDVVVVNEMHYQLVDATEISDADLAAYKTYLE